MAKRPVIGVTGPDRGGFPAWIFTWLALTRAGSKAVRLRPGRFPIDRPLPGIDGLVLGGGADVDPKRYETDVEKLKQEVKAARRVGGARRWAGVLLTPLIFILRWLFALSDGSVDRNRDAFEERCLDLATQLGLPVLGICRGSQFINIYHGGTLLNDLDGFYGEQGNISTVLRRKTIFITEGSRLGEVLKPGTTAVNSLHRQATDQIGRALSVSARDGAGVVQAIEKRDHPFLIGVQWHPEYLPLARLQQRLFQELTRCAKAGNDFRQGLHGPPHASPQDRKRPCQGSSS